MKYVTLAELEDIEQRENVAEVEYNGVSGQDGKSNWYTVKYVNGEDEDIYTVSSIDGLDWRTLKDKLESYITVDKDNVGEDGSCIVDFTREYGDFSINGKIIDNEVIIDDSEKIYMNH